MVPLPPAPSQTPHIPHIINTNPSQAGAVFGRRGSRTPHQPTDNSVGYISDVSINGHIYNGSIFDANGTRLVRRLFQYGALFIPWLDRYLNNYIGCFLCQHGYIILE